jgi:CHAT domain-containing protein
MGWRDVVKALFDKMLLALRSSGRVIAVPPERVDEAYDPAPFASENAYARLWLSEVQCSAKEGAAPVFLSEVGFNYGPRTVRIPTVIGPLSFQAPDSAPSSSPPLTLNRPLSPLFPFTGGNILLTCGLYHPEGGDAGAVRLLDQLTQTLSSPGFSSLLKVSEIVNSNTLSFMREKAAALKLSCFLNLGGEMPQPLELAAFGLAGLLPGYLAVIKDAPSSFEPVCTSDRSLCVVGGRLRLSSSDDFKENHQPLPEQTEYLLLHVEKLEHREDWRLVGGLNELLEQAIDASRQGSADLVKEAFRRMTQEIVRSKDLIPPDRVRVIKAVRAHLSELTAASEPVSPVYSGPTLAADLENEHRLQKAAERAAAASPFQERREDIVLGIEVKPDRPVRLDVLRGHGVYEGRTLLSIDVNRHARDADEAFAGNWRAEVKNQGEALSTELFTEPLVWEIYNKLLPKSDERLHLRFRGSQDLLRLPLEFLPTKDKRTYLVLKHPLARSVIGVGSPDPKTSPLSPEVFNEMYRRGERLSILLISSNTPPDVPQADAEIQALSTSLPDLFKAKNIDLEIKTMPSAEATFDAVCKELRSHRHHVVHYAGHGVYDPEAPESSYLPFWDSGGPGRKIRELGVAALKLALQNSKVHFVYLSCCAGAAQSGPEALWEYDFLGVTDGLLQAGIPSVLGYRWPIADSGGERMASAFYRHLAEEGQLDTALLHARQDVYADRTNQAWISPILILQEN